jgi:hypothetical protein
LAKNDLRIIALSITKIAEKIERLKRIKITLRTSRRKTKRVDNPNNTTDQDARALLVQGVVVEISYNIKQQWIISIIWCNIHHRNDLNALGLSLWKQENLGLALSVLVDKGYHNGRNPMHK